MDIQQKTVPRCAICGTTEKLLRCAKCKTAHYCSIAHQHMDWPSHKRQCNTLANQRKNNVRLQQLQQVISVAADSLGPSNTIQPPTTTYPLANATQSTTATSVQLPVSNGLATNYYLDNTAASINHNLSTVNDPAMSVIYGATINQQQLPSNEHFENMIVDPTTQLLPYYIDTNNSIDQDVGDVLSKLLESTQQQQQQQTYQTEQQYEFPHTALPQQQQHQQQQTYAQFRNQNSQHEKSSSYQIGQGDENVMANFNERRYEELCRNIINDMNQYGLSVVDDFLGVEKGMEVLSEVHDMYCAGVFQDGQLVNNGRTEQDLNRTIRGDKITWVKGVEPGCTSVGYLINQIDAVICRANSMKNNGKLGNYNIKERTKAMVACYPGSGARYVTHVDNPNKDGRVITAIYYLNVDWDAKRSGGVLRIFPEASNTVADIEPKFDRLIFFWSDKRNPHEVQPSHRTRYAITVWYFDSNEREAALKSAKYGSVPKTPAAGSPKTSGQHPHHHHEQQEQQEQQHHDHHVTPSFSKANENSNPNLNLNTNFNTNSNSPQTNLHQSQICT